MKSWRIVIAFVAFALLVFIVTGGYYAYYQGYIRVNYPTVEEYPVQGIDVSHHQQKINWGELDKTVVHFAFIKATEGGNHKDSLFQQNWRDAITHGIPVAAYHFFTFCKEGDAQARNYIHYVPKDSIDLPPVIDLEYGGNCQRPNWNENIIAEIDKYLEIIEDYYQRKAIIYTTNEFYKNYLINQFPDNPIWIRDILAKPKLPDGRNWLFWQYTNRGRVKGINTVVDMNAFNGSKADFEKLLKPEKEE